MERKILGFLFEANKILVACFESFGELLEQALKQEIEEQTKAAAPNRAPEHNIDEELGEAKPKPPTERKKSKPTGFNAFAKFRWDAIKATGMSFSFGEISKNVGEAWQRLSREDKYKWQSEEQAAGVKKKNTRAVLIII